MSISKIKVRGERLDLVAPVDSADSLLQLTESYSLNGPVRGVTIAKEVQLTKDHLIEIIFDDGTTWMGNADSLEELFPEIVLRSPDADQYTLDVPLTLRGGETERGFVTDIALKLLNIFVKKAVSYSVKQIATDLENKALEMTPGLYRIDRQFRLLQFTREQTDKPYLLFLHGTCSSTKGSFAELSGTPVWNYILQTYGSNVLGFQHRSLTESPLENIAQLVELLPQEAELHIISHSRGGLLGEILSRFCTDNELHTGFSDSEIAHLRQCGRDVDADTILDIKKSLQHKRITIRKFVRIACPASGTTLASSRLEHFLNITYNLIALGTGMAASPVVIAIKNLIAAVVDTKNNLEVLPGIEAMNPESPFIIVLNSKQTNTIITHPLAVIAGNSQGKVNFKGLLILASKFFYGGRNDLVVDTSSMYLGAKRENPVQFYFYEATDIDHFHYFCNKTTNAAILAALQANGNARIPGFNIWTEETGYVDRQALIGLEGGEIVKTTATGTKPILLLIPGIMGSTLHENGERLWIEYGRFLKGALTDLDISTNGITAAGLIATSYRNIFEFFSPTHDVVTFAFDWRRSLEEVAGLLKDKIEELLLHRQPVKIVAHSMGGVLARDFIIQYPGVWAKLNASPKFKLILLGAPLGGSFRIPAVLFGMDPIIRKLNMIDIFNTKKELVAVFARFPGLLNLLPLSKAARTDFAKMATWVEMRDAMGDDKWPLPGKDELEAFGRYRDKVLEQMEKIDFTNIVYIAGKDKKTAYDYRILEKNRGKELSFLYNQEGDQSVTWETGIPQQLIASDAVYYVNVTHGALANDHTLFKAIADLLEHGYTNLLSRNRPVIRGERSFTVADYSDFDTTERGLQKTLLGFGNEDTLQGNEKPLQVSMTQGDLKYAQFPLLAGHFDGDGILNAEYAIDMNLKGALVQRHKLDLYPGAIGTTEVLVSGQEDFKGAIIVGLGKFGGLTAFQLTQTVEQGISKYLINLNSKLPLKNYASQGKLNGISSLIIGCGYGGLTVGNSIRAILQAVTNANTKVRQLFNGDAKLIENVEFIEQYEDRALNGFYNLNNIEKEESRSISIIVNKKISKTLGSRLRLPVESMDEWWNRITVKQMITDGIRHLSFSASTGGAREEQRDLFTSNAMIENLLEQISTSNQWRASLAKTVFELLIPNDFKEQLKKQWHINWILDEFTAGFPWELLQDTVSDAKPFCINAGMIRQYATEHYRVKPNNVVKDSAIVIASPDLSGYLAPLPGALEEGRNVARILNENRFDTLYMENGSAADIIESIFRDDYKIMHLAGHGMYDPKCPQRSGMVIGKEVYLTTFDIKQMSGVPELVFINCCYLGKVNGLDDRLYRERYKLAANLGTQMIENGVKVVIAAGWAVDDEAAADFTKVFYDRMFAGDTFGEAVRSARKLIYNKYKDRSNTWGAYQCYGDPFYRLRIKVDKETKFNYDFIIAQQAEMVLRNMLNDMENGDYTEVDYLARLDAISAAVDRAEIRTAMITELEAMAYADLYDYNMAVYKFEQVKELNRGSLSFDGMERYCNVRSKKLLLDYVKAPSGVYSKQLDEVIKVLKGLLILGETGHRYALIGSANKRKSMMTDVYSKKVAAYREAGWHYYKADCTMNNSYKTYTYVSYNSLFYILILLGEYKWGDVVRFEKGGWEVKLPVDKDSLVAKLKERMADVNNQANDGDYWKFLEIADVNLCILFVGYTEEGGDRLFNDALEAYLKRWSKAGSKGRRMAEIEHLEFLLDALQFVMGSGKGGKELEGLWRCIGQLKAQLLREI